MILRATTFTHAPAVAIVTMVMAGTLGAGPARAQVAVAAAAPPAVGERVRDVALQALDGAIVRVSEQVARGPVVIVVLRGWPGYQCPFCTRQFGEYRANAARFIEAGAQVLFVYPGPADGLKLHAEAFTAGAPLPSAFRVLLDPTYAFTDTYGLRWDAPGETAYPSTFVVSRGGAITFARISRSHGDRVAPAVVLQALEDLPR